MGLRRVAFLVLMAAALCAAPAAAAASGSDAVASNELRSPAAASGHVNTMDCTAAASSVRWNALPAAGGAPADVVLDDFMWADVVDDDDAPVDVVHRASIAYSNGVALGVSAVIVRDTFNRRLLVVRLL